MKNFLFIGLALLVYTSTFAQTYHPFDTASAWIIENEYSSVIPPYNTKTYRLFISGDTTINAQNYKKVKARAAWSSNTGVINMGGQLGTTYTNASGSVDVLFGAIREDSLKRVYYYDFGATIMAPFPGSVYPIGQEILLYDFSLSIGDSILQYFTPANSMDSAYMHVIAIDSVQLNDSSFRKRFHLKGAVSSQAVSNDSVFYYWVEGIGVLGRIYTYNIPSAGWFCDSEGLLGGHVISPAVNLASAGRVRKLRCFFTDNIKQFGFASDSSNFCDTVPPHLLDVNTVQSEEQGLIKLFPNPFQQQTTLSIQGVEYNRLDIQIINATGQIIQQINSSEKEIIIYKDNLPVGMYFYKIWADKQPIGTGKLIIAP